MAPIFRMLAAESLGVRSMAVHVPDAPGGGLLIDAGAALGPSRQGHPPHPLEEEALAGARARLLEAAPAAARIVVSHYHHDHFVPFHEKRWIVSGAETAERLYAGKVVFARDPRGPVNTRQRGRALRFAQDLSRLGIRPEPADGREIGDLRFSAPMRHGDERSPGGWVIATSVATPHGRLVHMSDTQLLDDEAVSFALEPEPAAVIASGPPLYLPELHKEQLARARRNLVRLVERAARVVVDHHLLRGGDITGFLEEAREIAARRGHKLETAAASLGLADDLLESRRRELWETA